MTATSTDGSFLSRERLAGYDPKALAEARIVVVGAGALGQNAVLSLALSGVGTIVVVDPDSFEDSNRTRSPYYRAREGKAQAVAEGFLKSATALGARAYWHRGLVQEVGDLLAGGSDGQSRPHAVLSAVDSNRARLYLAKLCRRFGVPLVEAGFDGPEIGVCVVSNHPALLREPCWACGRRHLHDATTRGLCSLYARETEEAGYTPAIQSSAQLAGALAAEAAIGFAHIRADGRQEYERQLHERVPLSGHRWHLNLRTGRSVLARLSPDPDCQGDHQRLTEDLFVGEVEPLSNLGELLERLEDEVGATPEVHLLDPVVICMPCRDCGRAVRVGLPVGALARAPTCRGACSPTAEATAIDVRHRLSDQDQDLLAWPLGELSLRPGSVFWAIGRREVGLVRLRGTVPTVFSRATLSQQES
ncbi:MAG: ThiF family adenylyltransferase [Flavobacteriales bacterium]|nr:ThiF family adenylyltransferase [Flavobacteriales bacterium]